LSLVAMMSSLSARRRRRVLVVFADTALFSSNTNHGTVST
jgi:hypothetical protein